MDSMYAHDVCMYVCMCVCVCVSLGKLVEMFSEIASSDVTYFWFTTCSVSLPVVL